MGDLLMVINEERLEKIPLEGPLYIFKSCVSSNVYPGIEACTRKILESLGISVVDTDQQTCCGGLTYFTTISSEDTFLATVARNFSVIEEIASDMLVICNTCFNALHYFEKITEDFPNLKVKVNEVISKIGRNYNEGKVRFWHIAEFIYKAKDELARKIKFKLNGLKIAVHYGCRYLRACQEVAIDNPESPTFLEEVVETLGGTPVKYKEKDLCCGSGKMQRYTARDLSLQITARKIESIINEDADLILVVCPSCLAVLDNAQMELEILERLDSRIPVLHITQLIALLLGFDPNETLGIQVHTTPVTPFIEKLMENATEEG